jgi:hypothetical protein
MPSATYDRANEGDPIMRRAVWWLALLGLGVLVGFLVRLLLPRRAAASVYEAPAVDRVDAESLSSERRSA